jgi:hypothetical protein
MTSAVRAERYAFLRTRARVRTEKNPVPSLIVVAGKVAAVR